MCCIKDLGFLSKTPIYDPAFTAKYYTFPPPYMSKTTPLEVLISLTQLYACVSCILSGFNLIFERGISKLKRLGRISNIFSRLRRSEKKEDDAVIDSTVNHIFSGSIMNEANNALRNVSVGVCVLPIGISFFWLSANSLHITEAGWIGGLQALIHALTVMEIALIPLLYFMIKDASIALKKAAVINTIVEKMSGKKQKDLKEQWMNFDTYSLVLNKAWAPFWTRNASSKFDEQAEEKMLMKEIEAIEKNMKVDPDTVIMSKEKAEELEQSAKESTFVGYREYIYFLLNFIAFYGYMLGILVFYFDNEEKQNTIVRFLKINYSNNEADWAGNFAGDLMWTIEPIIVLLSPTLINQIKMVAKKQKKE